MTLVQLDLDGVAHDFTKAFIQHTGLSISKTRSWYFYRRFMSDEKFVEVLHSDPEVFSGPIYRGAADQIRRLIDSDIRCIFVTDRPETMRGVTRSWLDNHGFSDLEFLISKKKAILNADYAIDDRPENVIDLRADGTRAFLLHRSWNESARHLPSVKTLKEFVDIVIADELSRLGQEF